MSYLDTLLRRAGPRREAPMRAFLGRPTQGPIDDPFEEVDHSPDEELQEGEAFAQGSNTDPNRVSSAQPTPMPRQRKPRPAESDSSDQDESVTSEYTPTLQDSAPASKGDQPQEEETFVRERRQAREFVAVGDESGEKKAGRSENSTELRYAVVPKPRSEKAKPLPASNQSPEPEGAPRGQVEPKQKVPSVQQSVESKVEPRIEPAPSSPMEQPQLEPPISVQQPRELVDPDESRRDSSPRIRIGTLTVEVLRPVVKKSGKSGKKKTRKSPPTLDFPHPHSFSLGRG